MTAPAFTTVTTRRSLNNSVPNPVPTSKQKSKKKIEWSEDVRAYVQRSFAIDNFIDGVTGDQMRIKLKEIINGAAENNTLESIDWYTYPLPQHVIQQEVLNSQSVVSEKPFVTDISQKEANDSHGNANIQNGRKRKSTEAELELDYMGPKSAIPPWRKEKTPNLLEDRVSYQDSDKAKRMAKKQRKLQEEQSSVQFTSKLHGDLEKRKMRFENNKNYPSPTYSSPRDNSPPLAKSKGPVIGTCQDLEKRYFRLTAPPKPETVRPLPILRQTLDFLKKKWKQETNYGYICDQFKSLRQDLTVQHIKNDFTVSAYEIHARIALEKGDLGEYNQCQTQLRALYKQKLGGHPGEFMAYRILYFIYTCNRTDMNAALADLTPADHEEPAVKHALQTRSALALGNYHRFFKLYISTPNMGGYLMDMFINRERLAAMASICKAYKFDISLQFLTKELAFEENEHCCSFLCDHGGENLFNGRHDEEIIFMTSKAGNIFDVARARAFKKVDIKGQI